jgi:MFS family permease
MPSNAPLSGSRWSRSLGGIGDAFADANFRRYSVGAIVSWLSFFVQVVAVSWVTWSLTHSTKWLAVVALLDAVPMSVLAPIGGVVADRYDRFRILLVCYGFATLQSAALAGLAFSGRLTIDWLAALAFLHGVIHAFSVPAQFGMLPRFVERSRLPSAIAVAAAYTQLGIFIGPALAGWVILHFGPATAFASNVLGYGVYFCSAAMLRTPSGYQPPQSSRKAFARDFIDGVRTIAAHRGVIPGPEKHDSWSLTDAAQVGF